MKQSGIKQTAKRKPPTRGAVRSGSGTGSLSLKRVSKQQIQSVVDRIARSFDPDKIILFGSYAYGRPSLDSDVDLLVVMASDERPAMRNVRISQTLLDVDFAIDILVRTPSEMGQRLQQGDLFMRDITSNGRVMYERSPN